MIVFIFNIINSNSLLFIHILLMSLILEKPLIDEVEEEEKNSVILLLIHLYTYIPTRYTHYHRGCSFFLIFNGRAER